MNIREVNFLGKPMKFGAKGSCLWVERAPFVGNFTDTIVSEHFEKYDGTIFINRKQALIELTDSRALIMHKQSFLDLMNGLVFFDDTAQDSLHINNVLTLSRSARFFTSVEGSEIMSVKVNDEDLYKLSDVRRLVISTATLDRSKLPSKGVCRMIKVEGETLPAWYGNANAAADILANTRNPKGKILIRYFNGSPAAFPKGAEKLLLMLHDEHTVNRRLIAEAYLNTMEEMGFIF